MDILAKKRGKDEVHVFKTTLAGNGGLYGWKELDEEGVLVSESAQTYNSEADAEKAIRSLVSSRDIVEVSSVKNVNVDANTNVNLVKVDTREDNFGMNVVSRSIEMNKLPEVVEEVSHPNEAKMPVIDENLDAREEELQEEKDKADALAEKKAADEAKKNK